MQTTSGTINLTAKDGGTATRLVIRNRRFKQPVLIVVMFIFLLIATPTITSRVFFRSLRIATIGTTIPI